MPKWVKECDKMAALLKASDYRLKGKTFGFKMCNRCDPGIMEDVRHIIMQCPFFESRIKDRNV